MYDVILPTVSHGNASAAGATETLARLKRSDVQLFTVLRPSAGGRHGRPTQLFRRHMERMPAVQTTPTPRAAMELTRDVRPRRVVDVGAMERRRQGAAYSNIVSTSWAFETRRERDVRRSKHRRRTAGRSLTRVQREDRQTVWYHVLGDTLASSARRRLSSQMVDDCTVTIFNVGGMTGHRDTRVDGRLRREEGPTSVRRVSSCPSE